MTATARRTAAAAATLPTGGQVAAVVAGSHTIRGCHMSIPDTMRHDLMKVMEEERSRSVRHAWQRPAIRHRRTRRLIDWLRLQRRLVAKRMRRRGVTVTRSAAAATQETSSHT